MSLAQLSRLLPLPESELQQVLDYASTLSKAEAVGHFSNLLGDSPQAVDFTASFNSKRKDTNLMAEPQQASAAANSSDTSVPKSKRGPKKTKPPLHMPIARKVDGLLPASGTVYNKKDSVGDYITKRPSTTADTNSHASASLKQPPKSATPPPQTQRTAAGYLISDLSTSKSKARSNPVSRTSTPKPTSSITKVSIAGGTPMAGASTALNDLDAAIRTLELTTNPTLHDDVNARKCNCVATRHPLQSAAPNCLSCGKVICVKEGLGPCTYCGAALLSPGDVQAMMRELRAERGRERMAVDREAHRRAEVSQKPVPFSQNKVHITSEDDQKLAEAEAKAREHRDRLLGFQAQNARRTTVRDEAADFDVSGAMPGYGGANMWSTPEERAKELKRQQKVLREIEWNARPEYEKRRQVVSIDLVGGKVVKKMSAIERPRSPDIEAIEIPSITIENTASGREGGGAFSHNPLLGPLIKPVYGSKGKGAALEGRKDRKTQWRRVQDDLKDNEAVILDGGVHGYGGLADEPDCG